MASILRGEVYWADLNPVRGHEQAGVRPVLVVSQEIFNRKSGTVIALAISSQEPGVGFPLAMEVKDSRMPKRSWIKISHSRTISVERLGKKICRLPDETVNQAVEGLIELVR